MYFIQEADSEMKELQKVIKESTVSPGIVTDSLATCKQASVVFASSLVATTPVGKYMYGKSKMRKNNIDKRDDSYRSSKKVLFSFFY